VGALCAARPGETWWDTCAGAGGKTLALLDAGARVLATDVRDRALAELGRRARALGLPAPHTRRMDAAREPIAETFDGVLVDAPCSGLGMWSRAPDARWRTPPDAPAARAAEQRALLARAADAVAPGGRLVYSVCTLTRAETDEVADAFLAARADFHAESRAVTPAWGPPAARHWILPRHGPGGAMFVAVFRRVG